ncbi:rifamycin-inactivating phosphotransferase [Lentzea sp. NPDC060358]|uniref:rifamycin-inactivating phosphotransferase n=1 Tax=Lentzea sp. NPDC060358 TaxID=3347103 RepID=UPI0036605D8E
MTEQVLGLGEIGRTQVALCGGKGAHLGELSRIEGVRVPPGFCVTTEAFDRIAPAAAGLLDRLARVDPDDREAIRATGAELRRRLEEAAVPDDLARAIAGRVGENTAYAVRSSATAEDLPTASFAGQQDTYLNVVGAAEVLRHVRRCWASLFTERAVVYRLRNGFGHDGVRMAVVVQEMVFPRAAGVLFTADPISSDRTVSCVEASFGLGEALVSGTVNPDVYRVRGGVVVEKALSAKKIAVRAMPGGGTREEDVEPGRQEDAALTDEQVVRLEALGRRIEAHFGRPQDVEWCLADDEFQVVQSRPITTLFPVPEGDGQNRVYVSVGHQQMMTDAMRPLGLSVWQSTTPRPMAVVGSRLFVDVTQILATPASRNGFLGVAGKSDPLMGDALRTVMDRGGFLPTVPDATPQHIPGAEPATIETDPDVVTELIAAAETSVAALRREIATRSGVDLVDFVLADFAELRRVLFDARSTEVIMAGMQAAWWLNDKLFEWLGEKNAADTLSLSAPHNVTAEMGLELLDVADAIRPHPEVVAHLEATGDLDGLAGLPGGAQAHRAIAGYLARYGMRCVGEIDITRPRWGEHPATLVPLLLTNVRTFEQGAGAHRFEQGRRTAAAKERELLERLRELPAGEQKARETEQVVDRLRTFAGYREYPKYFMVSRYAVYKQALLAEAGRLVRSGVLAEQEDVFYLTLQELREVVRTNRADAGLVRQRREDVLAHRALTPPRVLTSDGEAVTGSYRRGGLPEGALAGLPVSGGTVEGRARVVLDLAEADLEPGDVLVTAYTDPSWSPLFVAAAGLVTEVGGLMTHGAVVAREYGLPAVVGLENATRLIRDGQRIRVNGTDGYVEVLPRP